MKRTILVLTVVVCSGGAAFCQTNAPPASAEPIHPGTAILDSMGIFAGQSIGTAPTRSVATGNDAVAVPVAAASPTIAPPRQP